MYTVIIIFIFFSAVFFLSRYGRLFFELWGFFIEGKNLGFTFKDLKILYSAALSSGAENKKSIFCSINEFNKCIKIITVQNKAAAGYDSLEMEAFLLRLYNHRTKLELGSLHNRHRISSTYEIKVKQMCVFLVPKTGVFYARVEKIGKKYMHFVLFDSSARRASKFNWENKPATVYFWKAHDAGYFYSCSVLKGEDSGDFFNIYATHSKKIIRTQKRKSVRAYCKCEGLIFLFSPKQDFNFIPENKGGIKCAIKNISEDGAMFYVKGKAAKNVKMKLQFNIGGKQVIMCGSVRRFLYDNKANTSRVHFHCSGITDDSKNIILSYVYDIDGNKVSPKNIPDFSDMKKNTEAKKNPIYDKMENEIVAGIDYGAFFSKDKNFDEVSV